MREMRKKGNDVNPKSCLEALAGIVGSYFVPFGESTQGYRQMQMGASPSTGPALQVVTMRTSQRLG